MGRTIGLTDLMKRKFQTYGFDEKLIKIIGDAEKGFSMLVWGLPGQGKSTFATFICKELTKYGKVYYNSSEQGESKSFQDLARHLKLSECTPGTFVLGDRDSISDMKSKLKSNRCKFYVIDSAQYSNLTVEDYKALTEEFPNKCIIIISWADGKDPKGNACKDIRFMVDIKIRVHQGIAYIDSRFGGDGLFPIPGVYDKFKKNRAKQQQLESAESPQSPQTTLPL